MLTKSGRFEIGKKICLNFTGYHHELWQPAWTIRTMLTALRAFMETPAKGVGAMSVDKEQRKRYAKLSNNYKCPKCNVTLKDIEFPIVDKKPNDKTENEEQSESIQSDISSNDIVIVEENEENEDNGDDNNNDDGNEQENQQSQQLNVNNNNEEIENDNVEMDSMSLSASTTSHKDLSSKFLDSFTVFLVIVIAAILLKKFAFRVLEQL